MADRLFIWGGNTGRLGQYHSRLDMFSVNMRTGKWLKYNITSDTPLPCQDACTATIGNTIYSYGGEIAWTPFRVSGELYQLHLKDMRWKKVKAKGTKPEGRNGAGICSVNGKLLLMGGYGPLPSERKHPQVEYEVTAGYGWNNELFEFDPHKSTY